MDVLVCLAERAGEVVTRQEIVDRVWATEFISDNTLTHAVTELRNALGDDARNPSFIETIHRRGYRLIAPVEPSVSDEAGESKVARFPVRERPRDLDEDRSPYPGLAAFTEEDAEFFFGREAEVARDVAQADLASAAGGDRSVGVGKSSFLRAGVIPARPEGWGVFVCQPGEAPFACAGAGAGAGVRRRQRGDRASSSTCVTLNETVAMVSRWRERHDQALLVVDQFEELFTLNPPEVQAGFAELPAASWSTRPTSTCCLRCATIFSIAATTSNRCAGLRRADAAGAAGGGRAPPGAGRAGASGWASPSRTTSCRARWWPRWRASEGRCRCWPLRWRGCGTSETASGGF